MYQVSLVIPNFPRKIAWASIDTLLNFCCFKHDVDQKVLSGMLEHVIADCINFVGVDVNSCSTHMLK